MSARGHSYRQGVRGRSTVTAAGVAGVTITARLQCSQCRRFGSLNCRTMMPPEKMDQKFRQA